MKRTMRLTACHTLSVSSRIGGIWIACLLSIPGYGQAIPSAGLQQVAFIPVPTWTTSGATAASFDVLTFNRVTGVMYIADRPNKGATVIDTRTLSYLGTIELPGCRENPACSPSGVLIAPDLQKLIVTDRDTHIFIYDLRVPGHAPVATLTGPPGQDELDYDPINQRAYIGNTTTDFSVTVVDVKNNSVLGSIPISESPEQPRFNPVDGFIYVNSPNARRVIVIDPQQGPLGTVINAFTTPVGCANAIDIDPVTNTAMLGCSAGQSVVIDLRNGATLQTIPITGTDIGMFNPHTRRWYMGSDNRNTPATVTFPCPKGSDGRTGVVQAVSNVPQAGQLVGVACGGRGGNKAGVDTVENNIFYPVVQYPPDPNSANTGSPGVLVFHDTAPNASGTPAGTIEAVTQTALSPVASSGVQGTVNFTLRRRNIFVDGTFTGLPAVSTTTRLIVTTTAGNETVRCGVNGSGTAFCLGYLIGDPLVNGVVDIGSGGSLVASGTITLVSTFPTFIPID